MYALAQATAHNETYSLGHKEINNSNGFQS